jgi:hypothetical protein
MLDKYEESLRVLGLEPGASEDAIKDAYRDLVRVWHPDRFGSDARLRAKAEDRVRELNAAFEQLRAYRRSDFRRRKSARPAYRPSDFIVPPGPASAAEHVNHTGTGTSTILFLSVALIAIVATILFMSWNRASQQLSTTQEHIQTPSERPSSAPATRQSAGHGSDASRARASSNGGQATGTASTASLVVASRPLGARVSFDGHVVGETPLALTGVTAGEHHIELTVDGNAYQPWSSSVVVTAGRDEKLLAVMTPVGRAR